MKKIWITLSLFLLFGCGYAANAASWKFVWDEGSTYIQVPLNANILSYTEIPQAHLYQNDRLLSDAQIIYDSTGDWLYFLTDVDTTKSGIYQVWYKASELKYQPGQCFGYKTLVTFEVIDMEAPVFSVCPDEFLYYIGQEIPDYLSRIQVTDNNKDLMVSVDDSQVDYTKVGKYELLIFANDGNNLVSKKVVVCVEDRQGPDIEFLGENNTIVLQKNEEVRLTKYFKVTDHLDGDITHRLTYPPFSTDLVRSFYLTVSCEDSDGNTDSMEVWVEIVDTEVLQLELYESELFLDYRSEPDETLFLNNVCKAYEGSVNRIFEVQVDFSSLKNKVGKYRITYFLNSNEKTVEKECIVNMISYQKPVIEAQNWEMTLGDSYSFSEMIRAKDDSDENISDKIQIDDSQINFQQEGTYPVYISVTNSSGQTAEKTVYLTITSKKKNTKVGYLVFLGVAVLFFLYWRYQRFQRKKGRLQDS